MFGHFRMAQEAEFFHSDRVYHKTIGKIPKTGIFCPGAEPGAPEGAIGLTWGTTINTIYNTSWYRRSVNFGILIGISIKVKGKIQKPKNSSQGRFQGPLTLGEIWSKALPGIVEA